MKYWLVATYKINEIKRAESNLSNYKLKYAYILIAKGIQQKIILTRKFIVKKIQEQDKLKTFVE